MVLRVDGLADFRQESHVTMSCFLFTAVTDRVL